MKIIKTEFLNFKIKRKQKNQHNSNFSYLKYFPVSHNICVAEHEIFNKIINPDEKFLQILVTNFLLKSYKKIFLVFQDFGTEELDILHSLKYLKTDSAIPKKLPT